MIILKLVIVAAALILQARLFSGRPAGAEDATPPRAAADSTLAAADSEAH